MTSGDGRTATVEPLTTEPGDIWPGPIKPPPTLQDLENQGTEQDGAAVAGSPLNLGRMPAEGQGEPRCRPM